MILIVIFITQCIMKYHFTSWMFFIFLQLNILGYRDSIEIDPIEIPWSKNLRVECHVLDCRSKTMKKCRIVEVSFFLITCFLRFPGRGNYADGHEALLTAEQNAKYKLHWWKQRCYQQCWDSQEKAYDKVLLCSKCLNLMCFSIEQMSILFTVASLAKEYRLQRPLRDTSEKLQGFLY